MVNGMMLGMNDVFLQTLCEQLRQENNELRKKMEEDHHIRNRDLEQLR